MHKDLKKALKELKTIKLRSLKQLKIAKIETKEIKVAEEELLKKIKTVKSFLIKALDLTEELETEANKAAKKTMISDTATKVKEVLNQLKLTKTEIEIAESETLKKIETLASKIEVMFSNLCNLQK